MPIIFQVSAWVILAVGFFALGHKFFPNFQKWLTSGKVSYVWLITITLGLFVLLTYPYFFNWWAINFWNVPKSELTDFTKLGPLGDIYGSLNTLISSIALSAVAFSAWLQVTSLKETRETNERQLLLAEKSHQEQLKESRLSIFNNQFFALLNFKNEYYKQMKFIKKENNLAKTYIADDFFEELAKGIKFSFNLHYNNIDAMDDEYLKLSFSAKTYSYFEDMESYTLYSYFRNYAQLLNLVNNSELSEADKELYKSLIANSMNYYEQVTLFFIIPMFDEFKDIFKGSKIFSHFWGERYIKFALRYYDESFFNLPQWEEFFLYSNKQP